MYSNYPIEVKKSCRIGDNVVYQGQEAVVFNRAGDLIQLKFQDASTLFVGEEDIQQVLSLSTLKSCPFCKGESKEVQIEARQTADKVYACMKCDCRFSPSNSKGGSY